MRWSARVEETEERLRGIKFIILTGPRDRAGRKDMGGWEGEGQGAETRGGRSLYWGFLGKGKAG